MKWIKGREDCIVLWVTYLGLWRPIVEAKTLCAILFYIIWIHSENEIPVNVPKKGARGVFFLFFFISGFREGPTKPAYRFCEKSTDFFFKHMVWLQTPHLHSMRAGQYRLLSCVFWVLACTSVAFDLKIVGDTNFTSYEILQGILE